jgi:hypothetical protein
VNKDNSMVAVDSLVLLDDGLDLALVSVVDDPLGFSEASDASLLQERQVHSLDLLVASSTFINFRDFLECECFEFGGSLSHSKDVVGFSDSPMQGVPSTSDHVASLLVLAHFLECSSLSPFDHGCSLFVEGPPPQVGCSCSLSVESPSCSSCCCSFSVECRHPFLLGPSCSHLLSERR